MTRFVLFTLIILATSACGGGSESRTPVAPSPPPVQACQANNTANVRFGNRSANTTHIVFFDGLNVATLAPGQDSQPITVAAGVAHRLETRIANSTFLACAVSMPIPAVCSTPIYTCAF